MIAAGAGLGATIGVIATALGAIAVAYLNHRSSVRAVEQSEDEHVHVNFEHLNQILSTRLDLSDRRIDHLVGEVDKERTARRAAEEHYWQCERDHAVTRRELDAVKARVDELERRSPPPEE